jgi:hypothetical protein
MLGRKDASTGGTPQGMCHQHHHQRDSMLQYPVDRFIRYIPSGKKKQLNLRIIVMDQMACQEPIGVSLSWQRHARNRSISAFLQAQDHWPVNSKLILV